MNHLELLARIDAAKRKASDSPKPCGRGWVGTKPPGCTRASGKKPKKTPRQPLDLEANRQRSHELRMKYGASKATDTRANSRHVRPQDVEQALRRSGAKTATAGQQLDDFIARAERESGKFAPVKIGGVKFNLSDRKSIESLISKELRDLQSLGTEANMAIGVQKMKDTVRQMQSELAANRAELDAIAQQARQRAMAKLERAYSGKIGKDEAKRAALYKRVFEVTHPRKMIRVPRGTTQSEYLGIVSELATTTDKKLIKQYTVPRPAKAKKKSKRKRTDGLLLMVHSDRYTYIL